MDVPAGVIDREPKPQDLPALTFAAAVSGDRAAYLASDCKYGYRNWDGDLSVTLINSAGSPDPYPERGIHRITVWLGASQSDAVALKNAAHRQSEPRGERGPTCFTRRAYSSAVIFMAVTSGLGCPRRNIIYRK